MLKKKWRSFYLISTAGFPNLGDEWITLSWLEAIFKYYPDATVFLDVHFPSGFLPLIDTKIYKHRVCCMDLFWRLTYPYAQQPWAASLADIELQYNQQSLAVLEHLSPILSRIEHIHFLGGGHFTCFWQHHYLLLVLAGLISKEYCLPVYWTGGSLYPFENNQLRDLLPFLSRFQYISFRDSASVDAVRTQPPLKVRLLPDDLILGLAMGTVRPPAASDGPVLLINYQSDFRRPASSEGFKLLVDKAKRFHDCKYRLRYLEFLPKYDSLGFEMLEREIPGIERVVFDALWKSTACGSAAAPAMRHPDSYAIGSRFHFHYYLAWHGIAGEFLSESPYYDVKHQSIIDLGSQWQPLHGGGESTQKPTMDHASLMDQKRAEFERLYTASPA